MDGKRIGEQIILMTDNEVRTTCASLSGPPLFEIMLDRPLVEIGIGTDGQPVCDTTRFDVVFTR